MALTPASSRPWISGTSDNTICQPDPRLQRPRAPRRPGRRPAAWAAAAGRRHDVRRRHRPAAAAERGARRAGRLAPGLRPRRHRRPRVATRLRRADARTGWLVATGGIFLTTAVAFSFAQGIFHPYYVAQLAPFTAALVGAGSGWFLSRHRAAASFAAAALIAGVVTELPSCTTFPGSSPGCPRSCSPSARSRPCARRRPRTVARGGPRGRARIAPARPRELGRADARPLHEGTFPAGGPSQSAALRRRRPGRGGPGGGGFGAPPGAGTRLGAPPTGNGRPGGAMGGGGFGGDNAGLTQALPTSASTAAAPSPCPASPARPPRSSSRAPTWPASAASPAARARSPRRGWPTPVRSGRMRWVLTSDSDDGGLGGNDGRVGSSKVDGGRGTGRPQGDGHQRLVDHDPLRPRRARGRAGGGRS